MLLALVGAYRTAMREFAGHDQPRGVVRPHRRRGRRSSELRREVDPAARKRAEANLAKARTRDSLQAFDKLTHVVDGERRIISDPPLVAADRGAVRGASSATRSWRCCAR